MNTIIYSLTNPVDLKVFYVGCTKDIKSRFKTHLQNKKSPIITQLLQDGLLPIIQILEECNIEYSRINEDKWVQYFLHQNIKLENRTLISNYPILPKIKCVGEIVLIESSINKSKICLKFN